MAAYCAKCGAKMNESDEFCGLCGAPVEKAGAAPKDDTAKKNSVDDAKKYKMIGIAVIVVVALFVGRFVMKGIGGAPRGGGKADTVEVLAGEKASEEAAVEGNDVVERLRPWMGDWIQNFHVYPDQGSGLLNNFENEGYYNGYILSHKNSKGRIHVNEEYIDFSDFTKDQKDRFPLSALIYEDTGFGADAFVDKDRGIRILFYKHFKTYEGSEDYGEVMKIQAYVGVGQEVESVYSTTSDGTKVWAGVEGHQAAPDGWAVETSACFVKLDD